MGKEGSDVAGGSESQTSPTPGEGDPFFLCAFVFSGACALHPSWPYCGPADHAKRRYVSKNGRGRFDSFLPDRPKSQSAGRHCDGEGGESGSFRADRVRGPAGAGNNPKGAYLPRIPGSGCSGNADFCLPGGWSAGRHGGGFGEEGAGCERQCADGTADFLPDETVRGIYAVSGDAGSG